MDRTSLNGLAMIQKHLWRQSYYFLTWKLIMWSHPWIQVYIVAIKGLVPDDMVECIQAFAECCYIARRNAITTTDLTAFQEYLKRFHHLRHIFIETGVHTSLSLSCQHSLMHYASKIEWFASPNGVCSSIMESTHITYYCYKKTLATFKS